MTNNVPPAPGLGRYSKAQWDVLLNPLTLHLRELEAHFLHGQPLSDFISVHTPLHHQHTLFLAGHSLLLGVQLLRHGQDAQTLALVQDLSSTVQRHAPTCGPLVDRFDELAADLRQDRLSGSPLHLHEVQQAATMLLDRATGLRLDQADPLRTSPLFAQLYRRPHTFDDPLTPALSALHPDPTFVPERQGREQELQRLLTQATLLEEQYAALLLLHLNARDRYTNQPANAPLNMAAACLMIARDRHTEARTSATHTQALRAHLQAIHQELERVRVPYLRPGIFVERRVRSRVMHRTLNLLRQAHYEKLADLSALSTTQQHLLWQSLDHLEDQWRPDLPPLELEHLQVKLMLRCCCALTDMHRAPGMGLPPLVEVAAQLSGLDPLWGWKELQPDLQTPAHEQVGVALRQIVCLLDVAASYQAQQAADELDGLLREGTGHLLACCRHAGVRLPRQQATEQLLSGGRPMRASSFSLEAFNAFRIRIAQLIAYLDTFSSTPDESSLPEPEVTLIPQEPEAVQPIPRSLPIDPPHVQEVRTLLQGRCITLIGGIPDAAHRDAIMTSLGLADLDWIAADEYAHGTHAHARVTEQTAIVVIAIRWMGHAHSTLRAVARAKGIPYVMHPGGLNPNSLAWHILQQTSQQLSAQAS